LTPIAHVIRPLLASLKDSADLPASLSALRSAWPAVPKGRNRIGGIYLSTERFAIPCNLTGQQLIDAGIALINAERVGLDLQAAQAQGTAHN